VGTARVHHSPRLTAGILFVSKDQFEKWAWVIIATLTAIRRRLAFA